MAAVYQYINATGVVLADTADILAEVQSEYQGVFGADLIVTPDTPQGALIAQETQARANVANNNAAQANQINPSQAGGVFLDAICAFLQLQRPAATYTQVAAVTLTGVVGTIIPAGVEATTAAGDIFLSTSAVTIPSGGSISVGFQAMFSGPVPCAIGALVNIAPSTAVLGWETITNPNAGVLGQLQMSDPELRQLRLNTLALGTTGTPEAITSGLAVTAGVTSYKFLENYNSVPMGMLIGITGGATLSGKIFGLTTPWVSGTFLTVDSSNLAYAVSLQTVPAAPINPWPTAAFGTTANVTLSGLGTQAGGDWAVSLTAGQIVLAVAQTTASQNGLWVAASGAWARHSYMPTGAALLGSNTGISMIRNSVWACVSGGTSLAVATSLLEDKSAGAGWNGGTSQAVVEPASGQTYTVLFDRPSPVNIGVIVNLSQGTNTSNLQVTAVQAMLDFTTGVIPGEPGWVVGAALSPFDLAAAIVSEQPGTRVREVQISVIPAAYQTTEVELAPNQQGILSIGNITINMI